MDALCLKIRDRTSKRGPLIAVIENVAASNCFRVEGCNAKNIVQTCIADVVLNTQKSRLYTPNPDSRKTGQAAEAGDDLVVNCYDEFNV